MHGPYADIVRSLCRPMEPIPTGEEPVLAELRGIRAVLFDLYGTLFISGGGDVGTAPLPASEMALAEALEAVACRLNGPPAEAVQCLFETIDQSRANSRQQGVDHPEVDIVDIWRQVLKKLAGRGLVEEKSWSQDRLRRLALEYEGRANPVWPMPELTKCLVGLTERKLALGIVSNAQFYTPELFPALLGARAEQWGFDPDLQYYSYRYGRAKPGLDLHKMAAEALASRHIDPGQTLHVGNDMLNDVLPASRVGFRTALFAGDGRSLRRREGDPRLDGVSPDVVLTRLGQLSDCMIE